MPMATVRSSTEAFAAADTWLQVTDADLLLRWDFEISGSDSAPAKPGRTRKSTTWP